MVIETRGLTKVYGGKLAVNSLDISVERGQIFGFLGPNGAGKSTFIKMLTGLVYPSEGEGFVLGLKLGDPEARLKMGYLPELFRFQEWMTGLDLLDFHSRLFRMKRDPERNRQLLARVGLTGHEKKKIGSYSKGMQQRLGLACALIPRPELLFLDEPTSALDPIGRKEVRDIILSLKSEGATVFLNSHLLSEVEAVCDSAAIIHRGSVLKSGDMRELLAAKITLSIRAEGLTSEVLAQISALAGVSCGMLEDGRVSVALQDEAQIPAVAALIIQSGAQLFELAPQHETLESVFLKAVSDGERSDAPSKQ